MPLTQFEECYALPTESPPELPYNLNLVTQTISLSLWLINSGVLTSLLLPHSHHPSQTPCLSWIPYATQKLILASCMMVQKHSEAFHMILWHLFPSLKHNFMAYRSSKGSARQDFIYEIDQLWQSGFTRVYSNCCCCYSFEHELIWCPVIS